MVDSHSILANNNAVLFSEQYRCWKLADFGSASQASSKRLNTTHLSRGTESYRAPEVVKDGRFNNRSDIFALGCIIFEIITGQKLFPTDWAVLQYALEARSIFPDRWPTAAPGSRLYMLGKLASTLLEIDPTLRPGAEETRKRLRNMMGLDPFDQLRSPVPVDHLFIPHDESNILAGGSSSAIPTVQTGFRVAISPPNTNPSAYTPLNVPNYLSERPQLDPNATPTYPFINIPVERDIHNYNLHNKYDPNAFAANSNNFEFPNFPNPPRLAGNPLFDEKEAGFVTSFFDTVDQNTQFINHRVPERPKPNPPKRGLSVYMFFTQVRILP
jgi:serine/threonine protein kinase